MHQTTMAELAEQDADAAGEKMRDFVFSDFTSGFRDIVLGDHVMPAGWDRIEGDLPRHILMAIMGNSLENDPELIVSIQAYRDPNTGIEVYWFHNGDTTLLIKGDGFALINTDAKKSSGWSVETFGGAPNDPARTLRTWPDVEDLTGGTTPPEIYAEGMKKATCWPQYVGRGRRS